MWHAWKHSMSDQVVSLDVVRRLAVVSARISAGSVLTETLQAVADGIVDVLGFGVCAVNHRQADGDFVCVTVAGDAGARTALLGTVATRATMDETLRTSDQWGSLRFTPHERAEEYDLDVEWIPDLEVTDDPLAWHPLDLLLAPLHGEAGELVGILSVDLPPEGRRPSQLLRELLEMFTIQAGIAIAAVEMRERYRQERAAREELLLDLASRDALTGLPNRRALTEALSSTVTACRDSGRTGAVLFCDVDGLKQLNDRDGHAAGDAALQAWARELEERVRDGDLVCRVGGDEFVVVADDLSPAESAELAERIREPRRSGNDLAGLALSVGVAVVDGRLEPTEVVEHADRAMYADKTRRRRTCDVRG